MALSRLTSNSTGGVPLDVVSFIIGRHRDIRMVELSVYTYHPHSVEDIRVTHRVPVGELRETFIALESSLGPANDIAFHSRVFVSGSTRLRERHIPLVDFLSPNSEVVSASSIELARERGAPAYWLFSSGRSFHLYLDQLLTRSEWTKFMGRLLLLNPRGRSEVVDARWVGHRLISGFAALRWSAQAPQYAGRPPRLVQVRPG